MTSKRTSPDAKRGSAQTSVFLISREEDGGGTIGVALEETPGFKVDTCAATLSEMNGTAVKLAASHDVILFRTEDASDNDLAALSALKKKEGRRAVILALSDGNTSLADAHKLQQAGVDDVLLDSIGPEELRARIEHWVRPPAVAQSGAQIRTGKVITLAQARGGIGTTTLAVNLADQLLGRSGWKKQGSKNVVLLDLDFQFGKIASMLDLPPSDALFRLATDSDDPDAMFLAQSLTRMPSGLSVLSAPSQFAPLDAFRPSQLRRIVELLRNEFDYVVIDLPRALVNWVEPVLLLSDRMLMVSDSSVPSIHHARRLIDFYTDSCPSLKVDMVINHEKKPLIQARHHVEAAKVLERKLAYWLPYDPISARAAVDRGVPLAQVAARGALNKAIAKLARRLEGELAQQEQTPERAANSREV